MTGSTPPPKPFVHSLGDSYFLGDAEGQPCWGGGDKRVSNSAPPLGSTRSTIPGRWRSRVLSGHSGTGDKLCMLRERHTL